MFDIGLIEIGVVLLVALFAIGPERMPEVARFLVKIKMFMNKITLEIKSLWDKVEVKDEAENKKGGRDETP